jgi:hypothetical protein
MWNFSFFNLAYMQFPSERVMKAIHRFDNIKPKLKLSMHPTKTKNKPIFNSEIMKIPKYTYSCFPHRDFWIKWFERFRPIIWTVYSPGTFVIELGLIKNEARNNLSSIKMGGGYSYPTMIVDLSYSQSHCFLFLSIWISLNKSFVFFYFIKIACF